MEQTTPKISVIIPVYNAEAFLPKCIDSLLNQSLTDFEVLLINDGSTDNSKAVCDKYANKDTRFKAIHKQNGGPGAARNLGLKEAKGEWVVFVDSDDWVDADYLKDLYESIIPDSTPQGLVMQGIEFHTSESNIERLNFESHTYLQHDSAKAFEEKQLQCYGYIVAKIYNLAIIKEHNLCFDESAKIAEDLLFLLSYVPYAGYIRLINGANYHYVISSESLSRNYLPFEVMYEMYQKCSRQMDNLLSTFNYTGSVFYINRQLAEPLTRAVLASYQPIQVRPKAERIAILKLLTEKDLNLIVNSYHHSFFILRINKWFLKNRWFRLFDIYNLLLFQIREQIEKIGLRYKPRLVRKN